MLLAAGVEMHARSQGLIRRTDMPACLVMHDMMQRQGVADHLVCYEAVRSVADKLTNVMFSRET